MSECEGVSELEQKQRGVQWRDRLGRRAMGGRTVSSASPAFSVHCPRPLQRSMDGVQPMSLTESARDTGDDRCVPPHRSILLEQPLDCSLCTLPPCSILSSHSAPAVASIAPRPLLFAPPPADC